MTTTVEDYRGLNAGTEEYLELTRQIRQKGLLEKQPLYYWTKIVCTLGLLALSFTFMALTESLWLHLINAAFMTVVFVQFAFLGHDSGHRQVFASTRLNDMLGLAISFLLGMERSWWVDKHNRHHSNPNQTGMDPDIDIPVLAFSEEEAMRKRGIFRFIVKYQPYLFFPMLCLEAGVGLRLAGVQFLMRNKVKYPVVEHLLMAGHFVAYFGLVFLFLPVWHGVAFIVLHQVLFGLYMGSVFAPNHKGMPILDRDDRSSYLRRQAITSRNINPSPIVDFIYGGLNYQIEHHLFPNMPRNRLGKARRIVREFCRGSGVPYYETGVIRSQWEILVFLHRVSAPLRRQPGVKPDQAAA